MSLNGLDNPAIVEAYQSALTEAGGWFLLYYISRDEVALLDKGLGGVLDVRNRIDAFEETAPLYGFLQYRRRKVVLSYLPEGVSRLVKARTTVQFQSVLDAFAPHDAVFSFSDSSELSESALSSACLLHTATGSITSSSSSLRRRRLKEIAEDAEEGPGSKDSTQTQMRTQTSARALASETVDSLHHRNQSTLSDATVTNEDRSHAPPVPPMPTAPPPPRPEAVQSPTSLNRSSSVATSERPISRKNIREESRPPSSQAPSIAPSTFAVERPASRRNFPEEMSRPPSSRAPSVAPSISASERPESQMNFREDVSYASYQPRQSTQSARPTFNDLERTHAIQPKVKLGPRPSVDSNGRPRTAGNLSRNAEQRPVAALPTGMRSSSVRKQRNHSPGRPRSQGSTMATMTGMSGGATMSGGRAPPVPPLLVPPLSMPISRPQVSPGAKSMSAMSTASTGNEKERLMKALQMRKMQMEKRSKDGKKNQLSEEGRKPAPTRQENKENIYKPREKAHLDKGKAKRSSVSESSKEPLSEIRSPVSLRPLQIPREIPREVGPSTSSRIPEPEPDSPTDTMVSDSTGNDELITSFPRTPTTTTFPKSLTEPVREDPAAPRAGSQTKGGPVPTSAVSDVPPANNTLPQNPPGEGIAAPSPPPTANPPVPGEQGLTSNTEKTEPIEPQSIPLPPTSPIHDPQPSLPDPATVTVSPASELQHDLTPEHSNTEQPNGVRKEKRKPFLEPIQVPTPEYSDDDNLLSDDSFMEELKSATVEEAKPISVGKSPFSPGYQSNGNEMTTSDAWRNSRAVSSPHTGDNQPMSLQAVAMNRSVSSPYTQVDTPEGPVLMAKKINVSSGISKRIKALEKFQSREPSANSMQPPTGPSTSSFESLRKRASVSLGGGGSDAASTSRRGSYTPEPFSRASSMTRRDSQSSTKHQRTSSVSVTAQIVREPNETRRQSIAEPESSVLNLQASPLTFEETPATPPVEPNPEPTNPNPADERKLSTASTASNQQSVAASLARSESRMSVSSSKNEAKSPSDVASSPEEKKQSRTSRFLRRMSSITSRKSGSSALSHSVQEENTPSEPKQPVKPAGTAQPIDIGEVNVQFPDTLLWKRRCVRVDEKGYLVLAPGHLDSSNRNMIKRYHLSEFQTPCLPEEDLQELPNSILLDFHNGSTLQCACESRQGQASTLQTLVNAHSHHQHPPAQ